MSSEVISDLLSIPDDRPGPEQIAEDREQIRLLAYFENALNIRSVSLVGGIVVLM